MMSPAVAHEVWVHASIAHQARHEERLYVLKICRSHYARRLRQALVAACVFLVLAVVSAVASAAEPQTTTATTTDDVQARGHMAVRFPTYIDALDGLVRYDKALHSAIVTHSDDLAAIRKLTEPSSSLALDVCALVAGSVAGVGGTCAGTIGDARTECLVGGGISLAVALTCGIIRLAQ